ncbi:predicted protein [Sclerotinia sclerotiorum 1980 UF-70]|uniref:Uncharacterized protein n=1 Tax=Sclerotinia sclerotiorum (strain ATCC 18683 / 1980 / Ss-1) TaxID=665079 RepID=A7EB12_SCLS1|nr:predicted protein [Sclerotinia sclerotiorum 1980 UF-70]EDN99640.1 predicted protein [Sclerotinia sclerotiorum 1980 UF-70]
MRVSEGHPIPARNSSKLASPSTPPGVVTLQKSNGTKTHGDMQLHPCKIRNCDEHRFLVIPCKNVLNSKGL